VLNQGYLDALVDAETLRLFMRDGRHFVGLKDFQCPGFGLGVLDLGRGARRAIERGHMNVAARRARYAARSAMRWIPGLRAPALSQRED